MNYKKIGLLILISIAIALTAFLASLLLLINNSILSHSVLFLLYLEGIYLVYIRRKYPLYIKKAN